jgi:prepilin-type N-terminal cleavage/methylation domain-containing protein
MKSSNNNNNNNNFPPSVFKQKQSFTLIELLVVIAILGVLATAVVLVLNPQELIKQGRDSKRLSDLQNLNTALSLLEVDCPSCFFGSSSVVYVSLPDTSPTCANLGLPSLPSGWSYRCVSESNLLKVDGTGWIPVDFTKFSSGSPLTKLPIDPVNSSSTGQYYTYVAGGSWSLVGMLESKKYLSQARNDGGYDPERIEYGTNLTLWRNAYGLVGYWTFDEGSGTTAYDYSGYNNHGTLINGPTWQSGSNCKVGGCLQSCQVI